MKNCFTIMRVSICKIHLVDRCLIVIMFLLLLQSAYSLFFNPNMLSDTSNIDIIVRTATASIFGYFLSSNFIRHVQEGQPEDYESKDAGYMMTNNKEELKNSIGFAVTGQDKNLKSGNITIKTEQTPSAKVISASSLQILIATIIAIFCLLVLILMRDIYSCTGDTITPSTMATISQFRDLVSGCVGFLIGVPTNKGTLS